MNVFKCPASAFSYLFRTFAKIFKKFFSSFPVIRWSLWMHPCRWWKRYFNLSDISTLVYYCNHPIISWALRLHWLALEMNSIPLKWLTHRFECFLKLWTVMKLIEHPPIHTPSYTRTVKRLLKGGICITPCTSSERVEKKEQKVLT